MRHGKKNEFVEAVRDYQQSLWRVVYLSVGWSAVVFLALIMSRTMIDTWLAQISSTATVRDLLKGLIVVVCLSPLSLFFFRLNSKKLKASIICVSCGSKLADPISRAAAIATDKYSFCGESLWVEY